MRASHLALAFLAVTLLGGNLDSQVQTSTLQPVGESHIYIEPSASLVRDTTQVGAGKASAYNFDLTAGSTLVAQFNVQGGMDNAIGVWLLDLDNYQRYQAHQAVAYSKDSSGQIANGANYRFTVPSTNVYYLVLDNGRNFLPRRVRVYVYAVLPESTPELEKRKQLLESEYQQLKAAFVFPDFHISVRHCGVENAFSNPDITICEELVEDLTRQHLDAAVGFVFLHELGHTLLRDWGLPGWDNEDMADEFATALMLMGHQEGAALQAAQWWAAQTNPKAAEAKIWINDRHTLSPQRARNIIHWINNKAEIQARWQKLLIPNMQTELLVRSLQEQGQDLDKELIRGELRKRGVPAGL